MSQSRLVQGLVSAFVAEKVTLQPRLNVARLVLSLFYSITPNPVDKYRNKYGQISHSLVITIMSNNFHKSLINKKDNGISRSVIHSFWSTDARFISKEGVGVGGGGREVGRARLIPTSPAIFRHSSPFGS